MNNIVCGEMKIGIVSPADKKYANKGLSGSIRQSLVYYLERISAM